MYRYILRESCSQFDSLPLTSLTHQSSASQSSSGGGGGGQRETEARASPAKKSKVQRVRPAKWKELERSAFLTHLAEVGDDWGEMQKRLPSRTLMQIRSYYSKNKQKLNLGAIVERARAGRPSSSAASAWKAEPQLDVPVEAEPPAEALAAPLEVPAIAELKVAAAAEAAAVSAADDAMVVEPTVDVAAAVEEEEEEAQPQDVKKEEQDEAAAAKEESVAEHKPTEEQEMAEEEHEHEPGQDQQQQQQAEALPQPGATGPAPASDAGAAVGDDDMTSRKRAREEEGGGEEGATGGGAPHPLESSNDGPMEKRARPTTDGTRQAWR